MSKPISPFAESPVNLNPLVSHFLRGKEVTYENLFDALFTNFNTKIKVEELTHFAKIKDDTIRALCIFKKYCLGNDAVDLESLSNQVAQIGREALAQSNFVHYPNNVPENELDLCLYTIEAVAVVELLVLSKRFEGMKSVITEINRRIVEYSYRTDHLLVLYGKISNPKNDTRHWIELKELWSGVGCSSDRAYLIHVCKTPGASVSMPTVIRALSQISEPALIGELASQAVRATQFELFNTLLSRMEVTDPNLANVYAVCADVGAIPFAQAISRKWHTQPDTYGTSPLKGVINRGDRSFIAVMQPLLIFPTPEERQLFNAIDREDIMALASIMNRDYRFFFSRNGSNETTIQYARRMGKERALAWLYDFSTELAMESIRTNKHHILPRCFARGINPRYCDAQGNSLLHYIALYAYEEDIRISHGLKQFDELCQLFKNAGLYNKTNHQGKSAFDIAWEKYGEDISEELPTLEKYYTPPYLQIVDIAAQWRAALFGSSQ